MICYVCDTSDSQQEAVAICVVCGMALCPEHAVREEMPVWSETATGMAPIRTELPERLPRILCPECYRALHQPKEG